MSLEVNTYNSKLITYLINNFDNESLYSILKLGQLYHKNLLVEVLRYFVNELKTLIEIDDSKWREEAFRIFNNLTPNDLKILSTGFVIGYRLAIMNSPRFPLKNRTLKICVGTKYYRYLDEFIELGMTICGGYLDLHQRKYNLPNYKKTVKSIMIFHSVCKFNKKLSKNPPESFWFEVFEPENKYS